MKILSIAALALMLAVPAAHAERFVKGSQVVWVGLNGNIAQLVGPTTEDSQFEGDEIGLHLAYSHFVSDAWAFVLSGGAGFGSDSFEPAAGGGKLELTNTGWNARVGFDRYAFINDAVAIYAGPGILYWKGKAELKGTGDPLQDIEWPEVTQIGFNGRMGMYAAFNEKVALFGHIGQVLATNSADEGPGKRAWWSNHHEGSVGLALSF